METLLCIGSRVYRPWEPRCGAVENNESCCLYSDTEIKRENGKEIAQAAHAFGLEVTPVEELRHGAVVNLHYHFRQCELALRV